MGVDMNRIIIALVIALFVVACGEDAEVEDDDGLDWSDPTTAPDGYESPYDAGCFPEHGGPESMVEANDSATMLIIDGVEPECVRGADGFGGVGNGCSEAFGDAEGVYSLACFDGDSTPCVWHALGRPPSDVEYWTAEDCVYEVVCVPEERWDPSKSWYDWDWPLSNYCPSG